MKESQTFQAFNHDVATNEGYVYTTNARLSSVLANRRLTDAALACIDFRGKRVLDVGCGDGTYTLELFAEGHPASIHGIDFADLAIESARTRVGDRPITYETCSAEALPLASDSFDIAHLRGVLHHLNDPFAALREAMRVAKRVVVIEPNGYSPVLKLLERFSRYHVEHGEKSYTPAKLHGWAEQLGGTVSFSTYAGIVPFFCPDPAARALKVIEPILERLPLINAVSCAVNVFVVERA